MASIGYYEIFMAIFCLIIWMLIRDDYMRPLNMPLFGMLPSLLFHVHRIHDRCVEILSIHGGTFLFRGPWFANMDILATVDPENVHYIMSENFENFPKGEEFKKIFDVLGDGIFNSDSDLWKSQRRVARGLIVHQRFHRFLVRTSWDKVENGLIPVLEHVAENGGVVDLQDVFQRFTFDTTCTLVTGYDPGCLSVDFPEVPFSKAMDDAEEVLFTRHVLPETLRKVQRWLGIGPEKKMSRAWEILDQVIGKYISMKHQELTHNVGQSDNTNDEEEFDLLTSYMDNNVGETTIGKKFDDKFLRDTILNLMIAGRDTTSSALTWFIWLVSTHPEVEKKIRNEFINAAVNNNPGEELRKFRLFKAEELKSLVYLHAALCESLRLYPPVPFQHKSPRQPDILPSGHKVNPKTRLMFSLYAMGRMDFIWGKDAWEFKPERWISEERGKIKHEPSYKFLAFNAGPRTCLGKQVAFTQMKAVAAAIIHNYHVRVVKNHDVIPNVSIILYMKHGLKVRVKKRWT